MIVNGPRLPSTDEIETVAATHFGIPRADLYARYTGPRDVELRVRRPLRFAHVTMTINGPDPCAERAGAT